MSRSTVLMRLGFSADVTRVQGTRAGLAGSRGQAGEEFCSTASSSASKPSSCTASKAGARPATTEWRGSGRGNVCILRSPRGGRAVTRVNRCREWAKVSRSCWLKPISRARASSQGREEMPCSARASRCTLSWAGVVASGACVEGGKGGSRAAGDAADVRWAGGTREVGTPGDVSAEEVGGPPPRDLPCLAPALPSCHSPAPALSLELVRWREADMADKAGETSDVDLPPPALS